MHDRPIPHRTHMPKYQKKKCATITTTATIQQNMYKYANTRKKKTETSRCLWDVVSGNAETETDVVDARRCTENCKNEIYAISIRT